MNRNKARGKQAEPKDGEQKQGEGKQAEPKDGEQKQGEGKQAEPKDGEQKQGEGKQAEPKDGEQKQGEDKQGEKKDGKKPDAKKQTGGRQETASLRATRPAIRLRPKNHRRRWKIRQPRSSTRNMPTKRPIWYSTSSKSSWPNRSPTRKLLDSLGGWSREDLERFTKRWRAMKKAAKESGSPQAKHDLDNALRSLGLGPSQTQIDGGMKSDEMKQLREVPPHRPTAAMGAANQCGKAEYGVAKSRRWTIIGLRSCI